MHYLGSAFLVALAGSAHASPALLSRAVTMKVLPASALTTESTLTSESPATTAASKPSSHPSAINNEFKYQNFDRSDEKQAGDMNLLHYAFAGIDNGDSWESLISSALKVIGDTDDDTFLNWFPKTVTEANDMDARAYVGGVFRRLYTSSGIQKRVSDMIADNDDFGTSSKCDTDSDKPKTKAYMEVSTGRFHVCPLGLSQAMVPAKANCSSLGDKVSKKMRSLSSTLLHEMLHWEEVGDNAPSSIGHITDVRGAYDPGICYGMAHAKSDKNRQKTFINDNNYMYLALNAYYNDVCEKKFKKPDVPNDVQLNDDMVECDAQGKENCDTKDTVNLHSYNT